MLGDVAGIGQLKNSIEDMKDSLAHTNELLEAVLMELRQLNGERMVAVVDQLQTVNEQLVKGSPLAAVYRPSDVRPARVSVSRVAARSNARDIASLMARPKVASTACAACGRRWWINAAISPI